MKFLFIIIIFIFLIKNMLSALSSYDLKKKNKGENLSDKIKNLDIQDAEYEEID